MKKMLLLVVFAICTATFKPASAQVKHALIFAIGDYPDDSGWEHISSAHDAIYVRKALESQNFTDIKVVSNPKVAQIKIELQQLSHRTAKGDIVVIHISSHGELIQDEKGTKANQLEPAIVGIDAKFIDRAHLTQAIFDRLKAGYLREDDFNTYVSAIRASAGKNGDVAVFMDLCHAGVGIRGQAIIRGNKDPLVTNNFNANIEQRDNIAYDVSQPTGVNTTEWAPLTVIGAANERELDMETKGDQGEFVGPLSYAIAKAFANRDNVDKPDW